MFLVSEDEYIAMGKHPEQQARLNAIALRDEMVMRKANKETVDEEGNLETPATTTTMSDEKKLLERKLDFHDEKHLHQAKKVAS